MVLVAGVLLVVALGVFLAIGRWKSPFSRLDLPKRLGIDIQQESDGFTRAQFQAGLAKVKITASKVERLKDDHYRLHAVKIEMYDVKGGTDRIEGSEFEYDQRSGIAKAAGQVEITLQRPGQALAVAPKAAAALTDKQKTGPLAGAAQTVEAGQIHVKTSGLSFDEKRGIATTSQYVQFALAQGSGSAVGATYDSQQGTLVLDSAVQLTTHRGAEPVSLEAKHAEFERGDQVCRLTAASTQYRGGTARATEATIQFRDDGSAERLSVAKGLWLTTATGGRLAAPTGLLEFDQHNYVKHGHLEGGVALDSDNQGRKVHGTAPTAELEFGASGVLHRAHLERGVSLDTDEEANLESGLVRTHRNWVSPAADLEFRNTGKGAAELSSIHGTGGVAVSSQSQRGEASAAPSRMVADEVTGVFGADSALTAMTGVGHAGMEETTPNGTRQKTSGDRVEAHFAAASRKGGAAAQIESATVIGHVVLVQQPAQKAGSQAAVATRATAERAVYQGDGEWLHLIGNPRVDSGGLQLTADKIDVSQDSGDAFGHGNVKATWFGSEAGSAQKNAPGSGAGLGSEGPAHVIAAEAQLHQSTGEATFRGQARLWQGSNSIAAPLIVLDRTRQTLVARTANAGEPVRVVLVTAAAATPARPGKPAMPSVIRVRGGELKYSDAERKAVIHGAAAGSVVAETGEATTRSGEVELILLPPGNHAGRDGGAAQVDRMTARNHVTIDAEGRRGTGEQLDYSGETGEYVLRGTAAVPPRMTDPVRGTVTGEALIFNSRDDSVNVEGGGRKTLTETTAPARR